jgi:hypothetical protein
MGCVEQEAWGWEMNERIKELAQEFANHTETMTGIETEYIFDLEDLERIAELVRQDERDACAEIARFAGMHSIADAIIKRGRTE